MICFMVCLNVKNTELFINMDFSLDWYWRKVQSRVTLVRPNFGFDLLVLYRLLFKFGSSFGIRWMTPSVLSFLNALARL